MGLQKPESAAEQISQLILPRLYQTNGSAQEKSLLMDISSWILLSSSYKMASEESNLPYWKKIILLLVVIKVSSTSFDVDIQADGFQAVEREPSVVLEQVMGTHLECIFFGDEACGGAFIREGEKPSQSEQDQGHLSSSDSAIWCWFSPESGCDSCFFRNLVNQNPLSEEKPHLELEKQHSLSDKSRLETIF
ncbi:hypothetical protein NC652_031218 [Populus alba x Populus x berolinensis]|nr:hypothetical protein NC652_031218 [Populus alba x Populus x berolinensis]